MDSRTPRNRVPTAAGCDCTSFVELFGHEPHRGAGPHQALAAGHPVGVRVTNYWNVFEAGQVAQKRYGDAFLRDSDQLTQAGHALIAATVAAARYAPLS